MLFLTHSFHSPHHSFVDKKNHRGILLLLKSKPLTEFVLTMISQYVMWGAIIFFLPFLFWFFAIRCWSSKMQQKTRKEWERAVNCESRKKQWHQDSTKNTKGPDYKWEMVYFILFFSVISFYERRPKVTSSLYGIVTIRWRT